MEENISLPARRDALLYQLPSRQPLFNVSSSLNTQSGSRVHTATKRQIPLEDDVAGFVWKERVP